MKHLTFTMFIYSIQTCRSNLNKHGNEVMEDIPCTMKYVPFTWKFMGKMMKEIPCTTHHFDMDHCGEKVWDVLV